MRHIVVFAILISLFTGTLPADDKSSDKPTNTSVEPWGKLKGQFVFDGKPIKLPPLVAKGRALKDATVCAAKKEIPDDRFVVNPENGGLASVFVYLAARPDSIHPALVDKKAKTTFLTVKNCQFHPHAFIVQTNQVIRHRNSDSIASNVHYFPASNTPLNAVLVRKTDDLTKVFKKAELLPVRIKCDIHPWMGAFVGVVDHPYATISDLNGKFEIDKVPAGELQVRRWHEDIGWLPAGEQLKRGLIKVRINPGKTTDLGTIKLSPTLFRSIKRDKT